MLSTGRSVSGTPNLYLIYVIAFFDLFAVSLIIPIFTTVYKSLQLDPVTFGLISSVYGLAQFLCNPVIGRLSDQYGRKSLLLVSFLGSAVGYLLLGAATTVWMLFLSRVVVGVVKQTLTIAQAWITDHCPHADDRLRALGRLRTATSLGFIIGPATGGLLSARVGQMAPAVAAALIYVVDFLIVFFLVDEKRHHQHVHNKPDEDQSPNDKKKDEEEEEEEKEDRRDSNASISSSSFSFGAAFAQLKLVYDVLTRPKVGSLLVIKFMIHLAMAMGRANFGLFVLERFGLGPEGSSYMASVMGVMGVITGLIHAPLTRRFPHYALLVVAGVMLSLYNAVTAFTSSLALFVALQPVAAISHLVLSTSALSSFSHAFDQREIGLAMGVAGSVNSIGDILAPLVAGLLFNYVGLAGPRAIASLLIFAAFSVFVSAAGGIDQASSPSASTISSSSSLSSSSTSAPSSVVSSSPDRNAKLD